MYQFYYAYPITSYYTICYLVTMDAPQQFAFTIATLGGIVFAFLALLVLILEFRDIILSKRIPAQVTRIVESPGTDDDGQERINRFPEIEFIDPNGKTVIHQLVLTNMTWRKPGDTVTIYYRPSNTKAGYKICSPFMWPKMILLFFLTACALLLLYGPHT